MSENLTARLEGLAHGVLGPMVLGGPMHLVPPIGPRLAMRIAESGRGIVDIDLRTKVDVARVRQARLLVAIDMLPDPSQADWALVAAFNDLLQATNHHLSGPFTRSRHQALIDSVNQIVGAVPLPATIADAVYRHASLARALEVVRTDTRVSWWAGSASFRGEPPAKRLLSWKEFRRVHVEPHTVLLADMPDGVVAVHPEQFNAALALWLTRSPLTDVAMIAREAPAFAWSMPTLALIKSQRGRVLATRAVSRVPLKALEAALEKSLSRLPADAVARPLIEAFAHEAMARVRGPENPATPSIKADDPRGAAPR